MGGRGHGVPRHLEDDWRWGRLDSGRTQTQCDEYHAGEREESCADAVGNARRLHSDPPQVERQLSRYVSV